MNFVINNVHRTSQTHTRMAGGHPIQSNPIQCDMTGAGGAFLPMAKRLFALWSWFIWGKLAGMRRFVHANSSQSRTVGNLQVVLLPCRRVRKRLKVVSASSCRVPSSDCHSWSVIDRCHRRIVYRSVWQQRLLSADAT